MRSWDKASVEEIPGAGSLLIPRMARCRQYLLLEAAMGRIEAVERQLLRVERRRDIPRRGVLPFPVRGGITVQSAGRTQVQSCDGRWAAWPHGPANPAR